ncbi:MAG: CinA family nicotinamide mononucleotide deamidase-related protein [Deltaproteobacteria bacterium]|nr:CinA family nicotinamide mononucleotide deamidase-related protein [Deltaproteobacteria bacterium]
MNIGIMAIGDELTGGMTQDTNSSYLAREIHAEGWRISGIHIVGDEGTAIAAALAYLIKISNAVIVMGGLGPTADDITTEAIATAFDLELYTDEAILQRMKELFTAVGLPWSDTNAKQARFPQGADVINNPVGTACGFSLLRDGVPVFVIPGVPREVYRMFPEGVLPRLRKAAGRDNAAPLRKTIKTFGLTEAEVAKRLSDLRAPAGMTVGFYPRFPENHIVLTARNGGDEEGREKLSSLVGWIEERLHPYVFGYDDETLEGVVYALLREKGLTLSVAESCSGGLITDHLTDVPGSSNVLERGVVVYSNRSKMELLGVPAGVIETKGAVSSETAVAMAEGIRALAGTDIGLATTGIAGPTGGTKEKPVGTVFMAITDRDGTVWREFHFRWDRRRNKEMTAHIALELLRRRLTGVDIHGS